MIYRALVSVEKLTPVEVEAASEWDAKDAILHSQFTWEGDETYQNPKILGLIPVESLLSSVGVMKMIFDGPLIRSFCSYFYAVILSPQLMLSLGANYQVFWGVRAFFYRQFHAGFS